MSHVFGTYGPALPWLGRLAAGLSKPPVRAYFAAHRLYHPDSPCARERAADFRTRIAEGETVYLLGIGPSGHNAGVALVEASRERGVRLICNEEEERYTGIKHETRYPIHSIDAIRERLASLGIAPDRIHSCLASWNYADFIPFGIRAIFEHAPASFPLALASSSPKFNYDHVLKAAAAPRMLGEQLALGEPLPIIGMPHHDNHAYFSWSASPFNDASDPVIVTVLDGYGDDGSVSLYVARDGKLERIRSNDSLMDSLGALYSIISSTQGGWTTLSSEGRYMGAAAWGDDNRLTNPFYRQLRQLIYFDHDGKFHLNRAMANWHKWGELRPYNQALRKLLGYPILPKDMWNPDRVLRVEDIRHSSFTQERVDRAAAVQMLFEDALFHVIDYLIRRTGAAKLVIAGGTALNCVANMKLLEAFDEAYYQRVFGRSDRLHLWAPPTPSDMGVVPGAAFHFALRHGATPRDKLQHAFYCGAAPAAADIRHALVEDGEIGHLEFGDVSSPEQRQCLADFVAYVVSRDGVIGLFQGVAETGPRALGHRSILANPCNPQTLDIINRQVKFREIIRPLAPMATREAAERLFQLQPGASDDGYNAYNYMALAVRVRPECRSLIPAVIHHDGTARLQIVGDQPWNRFTYEYLQAMGRRLGVEVSVNTSLNVGSPIVQTPVQALGTLKRAKAMSGLVLIGSEGEAFLAWHNVVNAPKDGGERLLEWHREWQETISRSTAI